MMLHSDETLERVQGIFQDVFDRPGLVVTRESNAASVDGWDSLTHINLVVAVEQEFDLRFALAELQELKNVGDMIDLIIAKSSQ